ncbi:MAG: HAD-IIIA family hydrolase [Sedimentisphaerales bacterium]|nr:HAD-IIIA family hydrolase [Sedimentisphaerales bacterium]
MSKATDISAIRLLVLDVDGVLTDGTVTIHADGSESKRFCLQDGHGIKMWRRAGMEVALLSGRPSAATRHRARQLQIKHLLEGCQEKLPAIRELLCTLAMTPQQVAYIGDDLIDIPVVRYVGLGCAVANAVPELKLHADYVTTRPGGNGAVREVIEFILRSSGRWDDLLQRYLEDQGP